MSNYHYVLIITASLTLSGFAATENFDSDSTPKIPRFSVDYMDKSVAPDADFYQYATGIWIKNNPVPPDKSRWASFSELQERNWYLIHQILDSTTTGGVQNNSPAWKVRDFYLSAMDTNRLQKLGIQPISEPLKRIENVKTRDELFHLLAELHKEGLSPCFADGVAPDAKNSAIYAFHFSQGGLGMPDRDYYLKESFAKQRDAYTNHIAKILQLAGGKAQPTLGSCLSLRLNLPKPASHELSFATRSPTIINSRLRIWRKNIRRFHYACTLTTPV